MTAKHDVEKILVLLPNWVGDAAMATPALRALQRRFPSAQITAAGKQSICELLEGLPHLHKLVPFIPRPPARELWRLGRVLAPDASDLCVVLPHSFRAALLARLTRARQRLGYARGGRSFLLTRALPPAKKSGRLTPVYTAREYLDLVAAAGCEDDSQGLELVAPPQLLEETQQRFAGHHPLVGLAPGAAFGPSKCWPAERYAAVADELHARAGARCVLLTGPGEEDTRDAVLRAARSPLLNPYEGKPSLGQLKAAIACVDLMIGNDSGPRHIAIAFKKPVVCIMGPTAPAYTQSPWERGRVLRVDVDCGPCQQPVCSTDHRCMTRISVQAVVHAALGELEMRNEADF
ncbi:MAG: lipopolysaccharide heptosyltransferase II [Candidatus Hydrogenedentes bacterium]|nr:lipopolysaccharide heptosyltransferase II [Candidatus Hydrogenedentota bacterium]